MTAENCVLYLIFHRLSQTVNVHFLGSTSSTVIDDAVILVAVCVMILQKSTFNKPYFTSGASRSLLAFKHQTAQNRATLHM